MITTSGISIIVPTENEEGNIHMLVFRIDKVLKEHNIPYEIIFVDDHSYDDTQSFIKSLSALLPVSLHIKEGKHGKAQSLIEGFAYATYPTVAIMDGDLQYPPEELPKMLQKIDKGADVVIANRKEKQVSFKRKVISGIFQKGFAQYLHHLPFDVQSGLKVFKKEIIERITLQPKPWTFDLEFLLNARNAGYTIDSIDIDFAKRYSGKSKVNIMKASFEIGWEALKLRFLPPEAVPFHPSKTAEKGKGFNYKSVEFVHHTDLSYKESAFTQLVANQKIFLLVLGLLFIAGLLVNWHATLVVIVSVMTFLYFTDLLFNLFLIYRSFSKAPEIQISENELSEISDSDLPTYSILCPLLYEWEVLPQFIAAMEKLEYPRSKMQVLLILEEDDAETIAQVNAHTLPEYFDVLIVPDSLPKTKPKALNYALHHIKGEYAVIYDAEDIPEPLQLKKSVIAFEKASRDTICIQAKLTFYNPRQNILTRLFTAEYSLWFDLVLTGLQSIHAPIPLGGTSNHFRTSDLHVLKGWDSFNVTEDCDLGMRLVKKGYRTAVIDSVTHEEANSDIWNWFNQRSRWIKGYIQTYLVHMRHPKEFISNWRQPHVITFQLVVGGKILSMFINPIMWVVTIIYFAFRPVVGEFIESFYLTPVLYMGLFSMLIGNFLYMYYYMIGCYKREQDDLIKYAFLVPFYWLAMSIAAWRAVYQVVTQPHYWAKTKHGLHLVGEKTAKYVKQAIDLPWYEGPFLPVYANAKGGKSQKKKLSVSICIPAYNEEKNIGTLIEALVDQRLFSVVINKIVVVSSGSDDRTEDIVLSYQRRYPNVMLLRQPERLGKASAINRFLQFVDDPVVVVESADTIPSANTIERLCAPFLRKDKVGMTGGAPFPMNDPNTFLGYIVNCWWWFHRNIPRFGEIVAFRNILGQIKNTAVDEAYIQAKLVQQGYDILHIDKAVVRNKGAETLHDLIKQRRRIFNGHYRLMMEEKVKINTVSKSSLVLLLFTYEIHGVKELFWLTGGIMIEIYARLLGTYDAYIAKINPIVWDIAGSTKNLTLHRKGYA